MSLHSMTGYAETEILTDSHTFKLQINSVNHRFLDFKWRAPKKLLSLEHECKKIAQKLLSRGSVEVVIQEQKSNSNDLENSSTQSYFNELNSQHNNIKKYLPQLDSSTILKILNSKSELWSQQNNQVSIDKDNFSKHFSELCKKLSQSRSEEGSAIQNKLSLHVEELNKYYKELRKNESALQQKWKDQLQQKINSLLENLNGAQIPKDRLIQEYIILLEKKDVTEEFDRIEAHINQLNTLFSSDNSKPKGKKIDFFLQEMHREWTTLGNKIKDSPQINVIIEAKLLIEKLKEQNMNVL